MALGKFSILIFVAILLPATVVSAKPGTMVVDSGFTRSAASTPAPENPKIDGYSWLANQDLTLAENATSPLPTTFSESSDDSAAAWRDSTHVTDSTAGITANFIVITIGPPLTPIYSSPNQINPLGGNPVVVAPEPGAFWSGLLCLSLLFLLQRPFKGKNQAPAGRQSGQPGNC